MFFLHHFLSCLKSLVLHTCSRALHTSCLTCFCTSLHTLFTPASLVLHGFQVSSYLGLLFVLKQPYISDSIIYMIVPLNCNAWKWKRISYMRSLLVMITWLKHSKVFYDTPVSLFFAWKCLQLYPKKLNYVFQYEETKMLDQTY